MTLLNLLTAENTKLDAHLQTTPATGLPDAMLLRILVVRFLLGSISTGASGGGTGLTDTQLRASAVPVTFGALPTGANPIGSITNTAFNIGSTNTSIEYGAGVVTAKTQRVAVATDSTVTLSAETGVLSFRNTSLTNAAVVIKASAGSVIGVNLINQNTVPVYVKFYDLAAASVAVGSTAIKMLLMIPASDGVNHGLFYIEPQLIPLDLFTTAISVAVVTGLADASTAAPATPVYCGLRYK